MVSLNITTYIQILRTPERMSPESWYTHVLFLIFYELILFCTLFCSFWTLPRTCGAAVDLSCALLRQVSAGLQRMLGQWGKHKMAQGKEPDFSHLIVNLTLYLYLHICIYIYNYIYIYITTPLISYYIKGWKHYINGMEFPWVSLQSSEIGIETINNRP